MIERFFLLAWLIFSFYAIGITLPPLETFSLISKINLPHLQYEPLISFLILFFLILNFGTIFFYLRKNIKIELENLPFAFAFGTGILSWILIILGITGNFRFNFVLFLQIIFLPFSIFHFFRFYKMKISKFTIILILAILPFFITSLLHVLFFPELYWDSLAYGINLARIYTEEEKIPLLVGPSLGVELSSNYPPAHQVLLAYFSFYCKDYILVGRLFSFLTSLLIIIIVYKWSKELFKKKMYIILSLLTLVSLPLFILYSRYSIFYIYFLLQASISFYFLYLFYFRGKSEDFYFSTIFASFSFLSSYLGIIPLFSSFFFLMLKKSIKILFPSSLIFLLISSPWLIRNYILLSNPIWPVLGGKYLEKDLWEHIIITQNEMKKSLGFSIDNLNSFYRSVKRFLFSYPDFYNGILINGFKPFFLFFVIPGILLSFLNRERKFIFFSILVIIQLFFYVFIFSYFERYIIAATLPVVFLSVYSYSFLLEHKTLRYYLIFLLSILFFNSTIFSLNWDECHPLRAENYNKYVESIGDREKILEFCYGESFKAWKWIATNTEKDSKIATNDIRHYYLERKATDFASWELKDLYYLNSTEMCIKKLCESGFSYIYLNTQGAFDLIPNCLLNINNNTATTLLSYRYINIYKLKC
jgi:hypothetical protein